MTHTPQPANPRKVEETPEIRDWRQAVANQLQLLARLHGTELGPAETQVLAHSRFPRDMALPPREEPFVSGHRLMVEALADLRQPTPEQLDDMAADFAAIYLNGSLHASPNESAWTDEDGLERQAAMFELRECYEAHGLEAEDWRRRQDDNLSLQLLFLSHLMRSPGSAELEEVVSVLDTHLLRWLPEFAQRVAQRCDTAFYAGLALLTAGYCQSLRQILGTALEIPPPPPPEPKPHRHEEPLTFMPGLTPSW